MAPSISSHCTPTLVCNGKLTIQNQNAQKINFKIKEKSFANRRVNVENVERVGVGVRLSGILVAAGGAQAAGHDLGAGRSAVGADERQRHATQFAERTSRHAVRTGAWVHDVAKSDQKLKMAPDPPKRDQMVTNGTKS